MSKYDEIIEKYKKNLAVMKENLAKEMHILDDKDIAAYDSQIRMTAEFISALKEIKNDDTVVIGIDEERFKIKYMNENSPANGEEFIVREIAGESYHYFISDGQSHTGGGRLLKKYCVRI